MANPTKEEIQKTVGDMLDIADGYGLTIEVVSTAMDHLADNPDMGIKSACHLALEEWDLINA